MNFPTIRSHFEQLQNSITSLGRRLCISCTSQRCQVHPDIGSNHSLDFIDLGSKRIVRVIHISPKSVSRPLKTFSAKVREKSNEDKETSMSLDISSEEYWFTRSNRPYRLCDDCNRNPRPFRDDNFAGINGNIEPGYTTNESNQMTAYVGGASHIVINSFLKVLDSYAERLSQAIVDTVLRDFLKELPLGNISLLRDRAPGIVTKVDIYNNSRHSGNRVINYKPSQSAEIVNTRFGSGKDFTGVTVLEQSCLNSDNRISGTPFGSCNSGFVNLSFSGSPSEPDEIVNSSYNDYLKVLDAISEDSQPVQYKFEASNTFKERLIDSDSGVNRISMNSRKVLIVEGTDPSHEFDEKPKVQVETEKISVSKEDSGSESVLPGGHICELNKDTSHLNVHIPKNHQVHGDIDQVNHDSCAHTKNTQKPLLLFLHGVGSSADVWSVILEYFSAAGYEVLAPDMLGHGYSSAPDDRAAYTFDRLLQDILQIFDKFVSDDQKCVAIGHSYGSCFAAALARYRPQQISQLVLLSSGGPSPLVPKQTLFSLHPCAVSLMKPFLMCGFKRDVFYAPRGKHLPSFCAYELPPYVMNHVERGQDWADGDSAFHRRILVPTLLVHGLKDPYISLVEECEMERTIPRSFLEVLPNAGHMQMLDTPEQLCHMIHCFITWWNS
ncbi:uncharacterized protein [Hetaerina americana]|uniref:uncharacterized protein n=1 Tax=Hetaerina americana TaxID=62018 RepID=UPI003A7F3391